MPEENNFEPTLLTNFVNSPELGRLLHAVSNTEEELHLLEVALTNSIIECAEQICNAYKGKVAEYNFSVKQKNKVFIVPDIRVDEAKGTRKYLTLRWVQFQNTSYRGRPVRKNNKGAKSSSVWQVEEIDRRGKTHYSLSDFRKATHGNAEGFLPTLLETEHCMRFLRTWYQKISSVCSVKKSIKLPHPLSLYAIPDSYHLTNDDHEEAEYAKTQARKGHFLTDPLALPPKTSLFDDFFEMPPTHQEEAFEKLYNYCPNSENLTPIPDR